MSALLPTPQGMGTCFGGTREPVGRQHPRGPRPSLPLSWEFQKQTPSPAFLGSAYSPPPILRPGHAFLGQAQLLEFTGWERSLWGPVEPTSAQPTRATVWLSPVGTWAVGVGGQPSLCFMSGSRGLGHFRTDEQPRRWVLSPAELGPCFPGTSGREGGSVCSRGSLSRA